MAVFFLLSGFSIPRQKLFKQFLNWRLHGLVQVTSFFLIPAIVAAFVHARYSGWGFGDDATALFEVLIVSVLGPFITAAWTITLLPRTSEFDPWRSQGGSFSQMYKGVFKQLGLSVLLRSLWQWDCWYVGRGLTDRVGVAEVSYIQTGNFIIALYLFLMVLLRR